MQFNSYQFIFAFIPVALTGYWLLVRFSNGAIVSSWLLLMSLAFYATASVASLWIVIPSILFDYGIARALLRIEPSKERVRAVLFGIGVVANILFLGYFKYKNFFLDTVNTLFTTDFELAKTLMPLGISFLTFQKIAFLADVQSGQVKSVGFQEFLLFTMFFPRTVAGPIVRYGEVIPQLERGRARDVRTDIAVAIVLFSMGLFKKVMIADNVAEFVPAAFDSGSPPGLIDAWSGVLAYTFQLYFDFSGYSDMALAVARMFGVRLPMNFNSPLKATSIIEFWSRWHITLTRFLTAYIYTPIVMHLTRARMARNEPVLQGKRSTLPAIVILIGWPTFITMAISGLWHGAGWQFVVWGLLHGIYLTINQGWRMLRPRWRNESSYTAVMKPVGFILTFGAVVFALVFFRADSVAEALSVFRGMFGMHGVYNQDIQLLETVGVQTRTMRQSSFAAFYWIVPLFLAATVLPNSLELLRRFEPALDFPMSANQSRQRVVDPEIALQFSGRNWRHTAARKIYLLASVITRAGDKGMALDAWTAVLSVVICTLCIMALDQSATFIYFQF